MQGNNGYGIDFGGVRTPLERMKNPVLVEIFAFVLQVVDCSWDETVKIYTPPCLSAATA